MTAGAGQTDRVLATVLFTDIADSTATRPPRRPRWSEVLHRYHAILRTELARHGGREVDTAGDAFLAVLDGPARAIRCACAHGPVRALGLAVRAGIHTGECQIVARRGDRARGPRRRARRGRRARGEVRVSRTVKDLVAGSGLRFADRGEHELKGVPDAWRLFAVES